MMTTQEAVEIVRAVLGPQPWFSQAIPHEVKPDVIRVFVDGDGDPRPLLAAHRELDGFAIEVTKVTRTSPQAG
jgi:hypothetical protein